MGWGVLGCRPNTTGLRVAGGMPGKPKRIRGCYKKKMHFFVTSLAYHTQSMSGVPEVLKVRLGNGRRRVRGWGASGCSNLTCSGCGTPGMLHIVLFIFYK